MVFDHLGNVIDQRARLELVYLERDTAEIDSSLYNPRITIKGPGRPSGGDVSQPLASHYFCDGYFEVLALEISPDASHITFGAVGQYFVATPCEPCGEAGYEWKVVTITGGSPSMVNQSRSAPCLYPRHAGGQIRWNHSGSAAVFALRRYASGLANDSELYRWEFDWHSTTSQHPQFSCLRALVPGR